MNIPSRSLILLVALLILSTLAHPAQAALPQEPISWQIVETTADHLRVDIYIHDNNPTLNGQGVLLGVPSVDGLTVHLLAEKTVTLPPALAPTPALPAPVDNLWDDPELVAPNTLPRAAAAPIEIAESGLLRDQPFVLLRVYPRIYDPVREQDRFYSFLQVELRWQNSSTPKAVDHRAAGGPFEAVLAQTLHNYTDLGRPQFPVTQGTDIDIGLPYWPTPKFTITEDGLYQVTYADLIAASGEFEAVDLPYLHLTLDGVEQPLWINDGGDNRLDPGDWLRFYAYGRDDLYTDANVYVLRYDYLAGLGQRMPTRSLAANAAAPLAADFPTTLHAEENHHYWQTMPNGVGQDHWFWDEPIKAGASFTVTLSVPFVAPAAHTITVQVMLRGRTTAAVNPNHHTRIYLNGTQIDAQTWGGQIPFTHTVTLSSTLLSPGDNSVRIQNVGDTGAAADLILLNAISLDYRRTYTVTGDQLAFQPPQPGEHQFAVGPFTSEDLILLDITDPATPVRLTGAEIAASQSADAASAYTLRFADAPAPAARYLALAESALRRPPAITLDVASSWRSPFNAADAILITHADFITATRRLADFHRSRGLRTVVVDVEDIYDEFSHSRFTPAAIRDFIAYAYAEWQQPAPTYVTLVGDATIDYRDYLGSGTRNYVPTVLTQTQFMGDTPTDNWFVAVSGDDPLPDLFIGRLAVDSAAQADAVIDKIIAYAAPSDPLVGRSMLMAADDDSVDFSVATEQLAAVLPSGLLVDTVNAAAFPPGDPQQTIVDALNAGRAFVHYTGHGTVFAWGTWGPESKGRILTNQDAAALPIGVPLPLITVANCLNGFFAGRVEQVSLAEAFQRQAQGGAIAVWAPTSLSYPAGHLELMKAFYQTLLGDAAPGQTVSLGAAAAAAKITVYTQSAFWTDLVETYTLFGDPSQRIALPDNPMINYLPQVQGNE